MTAITTAGRSTSPPSFRKHGIVHPFERQPERNSSWLDRDQSQNVKKKAFSPPLFLIAAPLLVLVVSGCRRPDSPQAATAASAAASGPTAAHAPSTRDQEIAVRDLSVDESMGGHTLARHVGKTDAQLADRLRREPQISSASTLSRPPCRELADARHAVAGRLTCPFLVHRLGPVVISVSGRRQRDGTCTMNVLQGLDARLREYTLEVATLRLALDIQFERVDHMRVERGWLPVAASSRRTRRPVQPCPIRRRFTC
jgi:hypothetical protein